MSETITINLPGPVKAVRVAESSAEAMSSLGSNAPSEAQTQQIQEQLDKLAQTRQALESAGEQFETVCANFLVEAKTKVVDLALDIAKKILMQEIEADNYKIDPIIRQALLHIPARQEVVVHLHPDDLAACEMASNDGEAKAGTIRFISDHTIRRAECILETSQGIVDSNAEKHLEQIGQALHGLHSE